MVRKRRSTTIDLYTPEPKPQPTPVYRPQPPKPVVEPVVEVEPEVTVVEYYDPLTVEIVARIDAPLHNALSASKLRTEAYNQLDITRQEIEKCPGAPKLKNGVVDVKKSGGMFSTATYTVAVQWQGTWQGMYLTRGTRTCVERVVSDMLSDARQYIISISLKRG